MTRQRRSFTPEFKLEAASLVVDQNYSVPEACQALDVGESALRRWVKQLQKACCVDRLNLQPLS